MKIETTKTTQITLTEAEKDVLVMLLGNITITELRNAGFTEAQITTAREMLAAFEQ